MKKKRYYKIVLSFIWYIVMNILLIGFILWNLYILMNNPYVFFTTLSPVLPFIGCIGYLMFIIGMEEKLNIMMEFQVAEMIPFFVTCGVMMAIIICFLKGIVFFI